MRKALRKVRAASICQACRVVYGSVGALLLWREANAMALGYWYTAVSWVSLLMFADFGFTATAVDAFSRADRREEGLAGINRERVAALATGYLLTLSLVVMCLTLALVLAGKLPEDWLTLTSILGMTLASGIMAGNTFHISLLQAAGHWEKTQYLPIIPYLAATLVMCGGFFGVIYPLAALALGQCILSFGLLIMLERDLGANGLNWLRFVSLLKEMRSAGWDLMRPDFRYYYSILACAAIMRVAMFAGSLKMKAVELGDIGRFNQTLLTIISVCFFPINGMANRVIGDLRSGKNRHQVHAEGLQLIAAALGLAVMVCFGVIFLIEQRVFWISGTQLSLREQLMLMVALLLDALAVGLVPLFAYLNGGAYWKDSLGLAALILVSWGIYLLIPMADFIWTKALVSGLVAFKIALDFKRNATS